ncbi:MAG: T9SS type A sorting domain-containing protein [Bacteroidetes bacterium]|nr:T9SS type A sorting domain-containing protein [Bacteroidota bacterium]
MGSQYTFNESAILVYYVADSLNNADDHIATSIQNIHDHELEITIFPNPAKDIIHIEFANQQNRHEPLNYLLYNIVGQHIKMGQVEEKSIPINETSKGIYFLELYDSQVRVLKKIIIE